MKSLSSIFDVPVGAHVALDRADGAVDVGDGLPLGDLTDEHLAGLGEGDHRRGRAGAFGVRDDGGFATLEDGDDGVRRAEVDADRSCHVCVTSVCDCVVVVWVVGLFGAGDACWSAAVSLSNKLSPFNSSLHDWFQRSRARPRSCSRRVESISWPGSRPSPAALTALICLVACSSDPAGRPRAAPEPAARTRQPRPTPDARARPRPPRAPSSPARAPRPTPTTSGPRPRWRPSGTSPVDVGPAAGHLAGLPARCRLGRAPARPRSAGRSGDSRSALPRGSPGGCRCRPDARSTWWPTRGDVRPGTAVARSSAPTSTRCRRRPGAEDNASGIGVLLAVGRGDRGRPDPAAGRPGRVRVRGAARAGRRRPPLRLARLRRRRSAPAAATDAARDGLAGPGRRRRGAAGQQRREPGPRCAPSCWPRHGGRTCRPRR